MCTHKLVAVVVYAGPESGSGDVVVVEVVIMVVVGETSVGVGGGEELRCWEVVAVVLSGGGCGSGTSGGGHGSDA